MRCGRDYLQLTAGASRSIGPRLWLDRGKQTRLGRKLINEEEVCRLLDRYSFERVDMGSLSVVEPNRHFSEHSSHQRTARCSIRPHPANESTLMGY